MIKLYEHLKQNFEPESYEPSVKLLYPGDEVIVVVPDSDTSPYNPKYSQKQGIVHMIERPLNRFKRKFIPICWREPKTHSMHWTMVNHVTEIVSRGNAYRRTIDVFGKPIYLDDHIFVNSGMFKGVAGTIFFIHETSSIDDIAIGVLDITYHRKVREFSPPENVAIPTIQEIEAWLQTGQLVHQEWQVPQPTIHSPVLLSETRLVEQYPPNIFF